VTGQKWDPERYAREARYVSDLGEPVVELLEPRAGERVLDLGCGDGALTERLLAAGCSVLGVDASQEMIAAARARGLDARLADAQALGFEAEFDAVFTNAVLHWIPRAEAVIDGVWRALRPGGRFVGEFGGRGNVAGIVTALNAARSRRFLPALAPWFNPGPAEYRAMLERRGFRVGTMLHFARPTPLPGEMREWLAMFGGAFVAGLPEAQAAGLLDEALAELLPTHRQADGTWRVDYVRLRFAAWR
jgi:SAM-dependent methyltransferase